MLFLSGSTYRKWEKGIASLSLLFISGLAGSILLAQTDPGIQEKAFAILEERGEVIIEFFCDDVNRVKEINTFLSVSRQTSRGFEAYANKGGFRNFLEYNIPYRLVERKSRKKSATGNTDYPGNWDVYPTHSQYVNWMNKLAGDFSGICRLDTIGLSVEGRPILNMKITDEPDEREPEPAFAYSSTMHGDELTGYVILLRLIDHLCSSYGTDPLVTRLVDNLEIWINPLANPDGTYWEGDTVLSNPKRFNSNNVDLNRNFPDITGDAHPDGNQYQPENLAQMDFLMGIYQVMGANIHSGAEVINYPFDRWKDAHADSNWYIATSREYADEAWQRAYPLLYMNDLDSGITSGWEWYQIEGGRMDWVNYFNHAREVTLEIFRSPDPQTKDPPPENLPYYWHYNYPSLLRYMEQSLYGIQGTVKDADTGDPLKARIVVRDHDKLNSFVYSDSLTGYYARPIEPGTWELEVSLYGYETAVVNGIYVEPNKATRLDVSLKAWSTGQEGLKGIEVIPNPFIYHTEIPIRVTSPGIHSILLYDLNGRLIFSDHIHYLATGIFEYTLGGSHLERGIYLLKLVSPSEIRSQKIFKSQ
jgi:hypothetical protein